MDDRRDKVEKLRVDKWRGRGIRLRIPAKRRRKFRKGGIGIFDTFRRLRGKGFPLRSLKYRQFFNIMRSAMLHTVYITIRYASKL